MSKDINIKIEKNRFKHDSGRHLFSKNSKNQE